MDMNEQKCNKEVMEVYVGVVKSHNNEKASIEI